MTTKPKRGTDSHSCKLHRSKSERHLATDWGNAAKYPRLKALGCVDPEPFIEDGEMLIRCRVTEEVFSAAEAKAVASTKDWIPTPSELAAAMEEERLKIGFVD